jgi:protein-tyrosine-phosphatase
MIAGLKLSTKTCSLPIHTSKRQVFIYAFSYILLFLLSVMLSSLPSERKLLLVCRGNTCRSTMALAVFRKYYEKRDQIKVEREWTDYSWKFDSAGTRVEQKNPANPNSLLALQRSNYDTSFLDNHASRLLTRRDFYEAHYIICMDKSNVEDALSMKPIDSTARIMLLGDPALTSFSRSGSSSATFLSDTTLDTLHANSLGSAIQVADPFGKDLDAYVETLALIEVLVGNFFAAVAVPEK